MIFLQDGVGGRGERQALILLLPGQSKAAVWQEQVSRTGVLFAHRVSSGEPEPADPDRAAGAGLAGTSTASPRMGRTTPARGSRIAPARAALCKRSSPRAARCSCSIPRRWPMAGPRRRSSRASTWRSRNSTCARRIGALAGRASPRRRAADACRHGQGLPELLPEALACAPARLAALPENARLLPANTSDRARFPGDAARRSAGRTQRAVFAGQLVPAK